MIFLLHIKYLLSLWLYFKLWFLSCYAKLNSSIQCHMILQKSFRYAFIIINVETVVLLNIFVETEIQDSLMNKVQKKSFVTLYMSLLSLLIKLMHLCSTKTLVFSNLSIFLNDPKCFSKHISISFRFFPQPLKNKCVILCVCDKKKSLLSTYAAFY